MTGRLLLCQIAIALLLTASAKVPASPVSYAKKGKKGVVEAPSKKSAKSAHEKGRPDKNYKNDKKGKKETSERHSAQSRHERHAAEVASRSRKGKFGKEVERESPPPAVIEPVRAMPIVPDRIQVIEFASSNPLPSTSTPAPAPIAVKAATPAFLTPIRKIDVEIPANRVIEIQQALSKRGFYVGDPSGVYDDATIDAMRRFQATSEIGITGYPTAPALKRLGLTNW